MKLAIVGSRDLGGNVEARQLIDAAIDRFKPTEVVSGGAVGIDTMAREAASAKGIKVTEFKPAAQRWDGPGGFKERNGQIADYCDALVRIVSSKVKTYGSGYTRDRAKERGVQVVAHVVELP